MKPSGTNTTPKVHKSWHISYNSSQRVTDEGLQTLAVAYNISHLDINVTCTRLHSRVSIRRCVHIQLEMTATRHCFQIT